ncbi:MAG: LPP20 family lipoprotein [Rickettsiales bacterium]|jgi:hypothetical protein|nr:LPP20 family lipoprotein [Rickettsiales bacterium]
MIRNFSLFFILLGVVGCFSAKVLPEWVQDAGKGCDEGHICAIGSGKSPGSAGADARSNLQKVFETKIHSSFSSRLSDRNNMVNEYATENLREETSGFLKGTIISKTFEKDGVFYALTSLNKIKTADGLRYDIEALDDKMSVLLSDKFPLSAKNLEKMYEDRKILNKKYMFLTGRSVPEVVKYENIFDDSINKGKKHFSYFVKVNDPEIGSYIESLLIGTGAKIVRDPKLAQRVLVGKITSRREFLNVDGFEKYTIVLNLENLGNNVVSTKLNREVTVTGINYNQIYVKAVEELKVFLNENFMQIVVKRDDT